MAVNGLWGTFFCYPSNMPFWLFWALFGSLEPLRAPESSQELSGASGSFRLLRASYSPLEPLRAPERAGAQFVPDQFVYTPYVPTHNWSTPFLSQHPIGQHPFCPSTQFVDTLFVPAPNLSTHFLSHTLFVPPVQKSAGQKECRPNGCGTKRV